MKKIVVVMLLGMMSVNSLSPKQAKAESALDILKEYGIPCALAVGISGALVKNDGFVIGGAICAGVASATFFSKKEVDKNEIKSAVESAVADRDMKLSEAVDEKIAQMEEVQSAATSETRKIMREILADRLTKMDEDIRADMERKMATGEFFPSLEKKLNAKIKEEVILEGRARNREVINQVVDEVIRQVVAKPVAVPVDSSISQ